jgi:phosphoheptose isomerase
MGTGNTALFRVTFDVFHVWHDDSNRARLEAFAVNEGLRHVLAFDVNTLNLFGGNVFALGQLEDVFLAIDDFKRSILQVQIICLCCQ